MGKRFVTLVNMFFNFYVGMAIITYLEKGIADFRQAFTFAVVVTVAMYFVEKLEDWTNK